MLILQFREKKQTVAKKIIQKETVEDGGKLGVLHIFRISNIPRDSL